MRAGVFGTAALSLCFLAFGRFVRPCAIAAAFRAGAGSIARFRAALRDHEDRAHRRFRSADAAAAGRHDLCAARHRLPRHPHARRGRCAKRRDPRRQSDRARSGALRSGRHDGRALWPAATLLPVAPRPTACCQPMDRRIWSVRKWARKKPIWARHMGLPIGPPGPPPPGVQSSMYPPAAGPLAPSAPAAPTLPPLPRPRPAELASHEAQPPRSEKPIENAAAKSAHAAPAASSVPPPAPPAAAPAAPKSCHRLRHSPPTVGPTGGKPPPPAADPGLITLASSRPQ